MYTGILILILTLFNFWCLNQLLDWHNSFVWLLAAAIAGAETIGVQLFTRLVCGDTE